MNGFHICLTLIVLFCNLCSSENTSFEWDISNADHFSGLIYENPYFISIYPDIKLKTRADLKLCNFILTSKNGNELPFLVNIKSSSKGIGNLDITGTIHLDHYEFYIKAKACDKNIFSKELKITLTKVKSEKPIWSKPIYYAEVKSDIRPGSEVVQLKAYELGKNAGNSICDYKIVAPIDAPFDIDGNGVVRSTNYLDKHKHRNYILRVMAVDCWIPKPRNSTVSVNIKVKPVCKFGWNGVYHQVNYVTGMGIKPLGEDIKFEKCNKLTNQCSEYDSVVHLTLKTIDNRICDLDISSLRNQWNLCGVNNLSKELLPSPDQFNREAHGIADSSTGTYNFDGKNTRWEIPNSVISQDHYLGGNFTISFWMKHGLKNENDIHKKEQILCNSDGDGKNRHHYSLFIHNCKLIFLYRIEPSSSNILSTLTPAEWRFKSKKLCDGEWHHYSLTLQKKRIDMTNDVTGQTSNSLHQVKLYIDGSGFPNDNHNPEIIDDVPMHENSKVHFTKLVIGACWRTKSLNYIQHFKGQLSGMIILRGHLESSSVIECINKCYERLTFTEINKMAPGTSISINSLMSAMTITASNIDDINTIFRHIGYINYRHKPILGNRIIDIKTNLKCSKVEKTFSAPLMITLTVLSKSEDISRSFYHSQNADYKLKITGDELLEISSRQIVSPGIGSGLKILSNILIRDLSNENAGYMESCLLSAHPTLDHQFEHLSFVNDMVKDLSDRNIYLNITNSSLGLIFEGNQNISIYQLVFRKIVYFNTHLDQFKEKMFKLVCSKNSAHSISNDFIVKIRISEKVKKELNSAFSRVYHSDIKIHDDPSSSLELHSLSETAKFNSHDKRTKSGWKSLNFVVIFTVCGIIFVALIMLSLLRVVRQRNQRFGTPFSRNLGPWVRLKPDIMGFLGHKDNSMRNIQNRRALQESIANGEMEWDNSEMYSSSLMDESLQITVNPLLDHETLRIINKNKIITNTDMRLDEEERSLEGLPDEYDGKSEDFREFDDDMTIEEDCNSIIDESDIPKFYQNGQSLSQNMINDKNRTWFDQLSIHPNPRYSFDCSSTTYGKRC